MGLRNCTDHPDLEDESGEGKGQLSNDNSEYCQDLSVFLSAC